MIDYTQLYRLLGAATCSYAEHEFKYQPYYPRANDDAIRDIATSFIVDNHDEIMRISKEKLYKELCEVSDKKFLKLKNKLHSVYGEDFCQKYWENGKDINLNTSDGAYFIYDCTDSMTDVEYEHFFHSLVFVPNWDFIYDILTYNFAGKPAEEEPILFGHWDSKSNKELTKYYVKEGLHWLGCLWQAGGSPWRHNDPARCVYNIDKKIGISYANDTYFWSWQQMVKKTDGQPGTWVSYDENNDERYWKYMEWYIKYFLTHPVKKPKDIFEHMYVDWHQKYEIAMLNIIINIPRSYKYEEPVRAFVGLNDLAKRKMNRILQFMEDEYADNDFLPKFKNRLYYNEDKGIIIYSKDEVIAERIKNICK